MALTATIHHFTIRLSDVDRGVYETLELKAAKHPSESDEYLVTRVLAYCLEYAEGIAFSPGLSEPDEPPIAVRDLTGALKAWIEIGSPDAARLHKAAKAAPRVAVYTHKDPALLLRSLDGERIHRAEALELVLARPRAGGEPGQAPRAAQRPRPVGHRPPPLCDDRRRDAVGRSGASGARMIVNWSVPYFSRHGHGHFSPVLNIASGVISRTAEQPPRR